MSIIDSLFGWAKPREYKTPEQPMFTTVTVTAETKPKKPRKPRAKKPEPALEPVAEKPQVNAEVKVLKLDFDPQNPRLGSLELDWNDQFIDLLAEHGYRGGTAEELVDAWLNDICRNILANSYPGANVTNMDGSRYVKQRDIGDGKTEVS
jgi:hypothetical protein